MFATFGYFLALNVAHSLKYLSSVFFGGEMKHKQFKKSRQLWLQFLKSAMYTTLYTLSKHSNPHSTRTSTSSPKKSHSLYHNS
nr:MAG TPA: hypothetical protein [Caudoviricetes sp.]